MNELQIIDERTVLDKNFKIYGDISNPLFLARDVARWIEHTDVFMMLKSIDDDEKLTQVMFASGQKRKMWFLTEDGLYEVLMQSRKPVAKEFKKEIKKILKQIRLTGGYIPTKQEDTEADILSKAFIIATRTIKEKEKLIAEMEPKADYYDTLVECGLNTNLRDTAKELGIRQNRFVKFLEAKGYIYRDKAGKIKPYSEYTTAEDCYGYFIVKEATNGEWAGIQTLVTPKGRKYLLKVLSKKGYI